MALKLCDCDPNISTPISCSSCEWVMQPSSFIPTLGALIGKGYTAKFFPPKFYRDGKGCVATLTPPRFGDPKMSGVM